MVIYRVPQRLGPKEIDMTVVAGGEDPSLVNLVDLADYPRDDLGYPRSAITPGIMHFGFGNFHRSHQASYLHRLQQGQEASDWGICGVGILDSDANMRDAMRAQDCLFTVIERHPDGGLDVEVVGSVIEYCYAPEDPEAVLDRLADPRIRIVSLTVTEGGYLRDPATGRFDPQHRDVLHDAQHPDTPVTAFGYIVEGLRRRRMLDQAPFTVMSCDNLQGNSDAAREAILGIARLREAGLAEWITANVAFPNGMVDRITPATTDADRATLARDFGITDRWPVPCEPFTQWILEDHFPAGRPDLAAVGVQFVDDVQPYEFMKLRLLNASHQALAYLAGPAGYRLVDEAMRDESIRSFLRAYMQREARPTLGPLPGVDVDAYIDMIIERFSNPQIMDTVLRLATDSTNRIATFVIPVIAENLEAGRSIDLGATVIAAWAEYWAAIERGEIPAPLVPEDRFADTLRRLAVDNDPEAFAGDRTLVGALADSEQFRQSVARQRHRLMAAGMPATVARLLAEPESGPSTANPPRQ